MSEDVPQVLINPEDVATLYFQLEPRAGGVLPGDLQAPQVSVDRGVTWKNLTLGVDLDNQAAYAWVIAGQGVSPVPAGVDEALIGPVTKCLFRVRGPVKIKTKAFIIRSQNPWIE